MKVHSVVLVVGQLPGRTADVFVCEGDTNKFSQVSKPFSLLPKMRHRGMEVWGDYSWRKTKPFTIVRCWHTWSVFDNDWLAHTQVSVFFLAQNGLDQIFLFSEEFLLMDAVVLG